MTNFISSVLALGQAKFTNQFTDLAEWRPVDHAAISTMNMGIIANPLLRELRTSEKRSVTAYLPIRQAAGGGTGRSYNHTGSFGDSKAVPVSWGTLSETFKISETLANNNVLTGAEMFASELKNAIDNLLIRSNALLVASLVADKSLVSKGGANGTFAAGDYTLPNSYADFYFQEVQAMMRKNRYTTPLISIADSKALVLAQKIGWQGAQNAQNLNPQFAGQTIVGTNEALLGGEGSVLTFPANGVAFQPWIPIENRKPLDGNKILTSVGTKGQIFVPELGVNFAVHAYSSRADTDAAGGSAQDVVTEFEISIDWAYLSSPLSVATETNIFASILSA